MEGPPATAGVQAGQQQLALAAPSAALNSVQAVVTTKQPASYVFYPERFTEVTGNFWKLSTVVDQASLQSRSADRTAIGRFVSEMDNRLEF